MVDNSDVFRKGDVMAKLGEEMKQIMKDKAAMLDPNMKQHDSDDEEISSDEEN
jgi:hypothetical protein